MIREELKPMTIGRLLDKSFKLTMSSIRTHFKAHLIFSGLFAGLTALTIVILLFAAYKMEDFAGGLIIIICLAIYLIFIPPYSIFWYIMICDMQIKSFLEEEWRFKESFRLARGRFWPVLLGGLLSGIILLIGLAFCLAGFPLALALLASVVPAVIHERRGGFAAIRRSFRLTAYSFWSVTGPVFLFIMALFAIQIVFMIASLTVLVMAISIPVLENEYAVLTILIVQAIIYLGMLLFLFLLGATLSVLIFFNQRIKYESLGMELMAESMLAELNGESEQTPQIIDKSL